MGFLIIVFGFISAAVVGYLTDDLNWFLFLVIISYITGSIVLLDSKNREIKRINAQKELNIKKIKEAYTKILKSIKIPEIHDIVNYTKGGLNLVKGKQYCWIENNMLCFFPFEVPTKAYLLSQLNLIKIRLEKIDYYSIEEKEIKEKKIEKVADENSLNSLNQDTIINDLKRIALKCKDDEGETRYLYFDMNDLDVFDKIIPDKFIDRISKTEQSEHDSFNIEDELSTKITDQIREIAKLKDEGILTDDEFTEKKKLLLERI